MLGTFNKGADVGKTRTRTGSIGKDGDETVIREIRRVFADMGNRIHLGACGLGERLSLVMKTVMEKIQRPWRMSLKQWRSLVWVRLRTFKNQGVLQFDDGNVARLSRRQMKRAQADAVREWTGDRRTAARAPREGRRAYRNHYRMAYAA